MTVITSREELAQVLAQELPRAIKQANTENLEKLYTRKQAAKLLSRSERTIRRMVKRGNISTTADGLYISQRAINEYLTGKP